MEDINKYSSFDVSAVRRQLPRAINKVVCCSRSKNEMCSPLDTVHSEAGMCRGWISSNIAHINVQSVVRWIKIPTIRVALGNELLEIIERNDKKIARAKVSTGSRVMEVHSHLKFTFVLFGWVYKKEFGGF